MYREENKFLDLDIVAERIVNSGDRDMFREAIKCYHIGSHRAAVILAWMATADCLKRRLVELKREGDSVARDAVDNVLAPLDGQALYEENLIAQSKKCELFDDYEEKCLRFARDTRSKCAHPSGVNPSAEAVRHILEICSQVVLCRKGYRGIPFVRNVVTVQFDDLYFLSYEPRIKETCLDIINKVPMRLWYLFTILAAEERPEAIGEIWRNNAHIFFKNLLEECRDDSLANQIANGMQGFEEKAQDFFALLVGLDVRVGKFWGRQKRDQARARLASTSLFQLAQAKQQEIESWAFICAQDGLEDNDLDLLRQKIGVLSKHFPKEFLQARSVELYKLLVEMTEDDNLSTQAALALGNLLPSPLGQEPDAALENNDSPPGTRIERILKQAIQRLETEKYRSLFENVKSWRDNILIGFLELSEDFLWKCGENNPDDIYCLFDATSELLERNPLRIPNKFNEAIKSVLEGQIHSEWRSVDSEAGNNFKGSLELLFTRYPSNFIDLQKECQPLLSSYFPEEDDDNEELELSSENESDGV